MMNKNTTLICIGLLLLPGLLTAQSPQKTDTVIINLAKTSQVIFTMRDSTDLEILRHFDFQQLFDDILTKLEDNDTTSSREEVSQNDRPRDEEEPWRLEDGEDEDKEDDDDDYNRRHDKDDDDDDDWERYYSRKWGKTWQSFNFDLGMNNYLSDGKFPDDSNAPYSVRPWGSWYVGINSIHRTKVAGKFFLEWGLGLSWYNFKFQKDNIMVQKDDAGVYFLEDTVHSDFIKSKLTATYINASLIPVLDFGGRGKKSRMWDSDGGSFRVGIGPYVGYRIGSYSKLVYEEGSDREKEKSRNNYYLENFRYGMRMQVGFRSTDIFFNYDMNDLFAAEKGPSLNAFSFGVIF